jgi:NAD(P)-dependent dehydrogenase (short-subunit alcohol dehydrogenase family)
MTTRPHASYRFDNAVVLITGAGRGIGRGIAHQFAREGARVAVLDRDPESCQRVVREIVDLGGSAFPVIADLGDAAARGDVIQRVLEASFGRLDVLVHNAAILGPRRLLTELSDTDVRGVLEVNLVAPLLLCRDALPALARTRGALVFVSSIQASLPLPTFVSYAATKGGLESVTRALAVEMAASGVRVNAVAPGAVESPAMREQWEAATGSAAQPHAPTLVGRWGTDQDIAEVVTFLSSPAAEFVSGEVIRVDGGRLLSRDVDPLDSNR